MLEGPRVCTDPGKSGFSYWSVVKHSKPKKHSGHLSPFINMNYNELLFIINKVILL